MLDVSVKVLVWGCRPCYNRNYPYVGEPVPADSKMNPLLAKAKTINDIGSTSVITHLRKGRTYCTAAVRERSEKNMEE